MAPASDDRSGDASDDLHRLRAEIDRINRELVDRLQQRARLCRRIAAHKRAAGLPAVDPDRERQMLDRLLQDGQQDLQEGRLGGAGPGFDREALRRILSSVLRESRALVEDPDA